MRKKSTQKIQATISGDVSGQVAVGQNINQVSTKTTVAVTKTELKELRQVLKDLRAKVEKESQADKKDAALERVQELEQAIAEKKPDLSTIANFAVGLEALRLELVKEPIFNAVYEMMHEVDAAKYPNIY